jgi:hypothetical protein
MIVIVEVVISVPESSPFSSRKVQLPFLTILEAALTVLGLKNVAFHDSGADAANTEIIEVVVMAHHMDVAHFLAAAEFTFGCCILVIHFICNVDHLHAIPAGERRTIFF